MQPMNTLRAALLIGATMTMGFVAGAFALYAHAIMPGLRSTDDHTFVAAFQSIDRAIINPWFMATAFVGALIFTAAAVATTVGRAALPWVAVALGLYLIAFVITVAVNVPLNDAIKAAGNPDHIRDLAGVRARFHEARWAAWNLIRVVASTGAFGCLAWALVLYGRGAA
jgi:uncharacterized membrane protein